MINTKLNAGHFFLNTNILYFQGGIPKPSKPILHFNRDELKGLPFTFPAKIVRQVLL